MGIGCTRLEERVQAAFGGLQGVDPVFEAGSDVKAAGVLWAVPALLSNGLLGFSEKHFPALKGFYRLQSLLLILAFMALLRIRSLEGLRYWDPGELGKVVGLDRVPEVRTLRQKVETLVTKGQPERWSRELSRYWMDQTEEGIGTLYVDGHVRVYHGKQTKLPRRYVAREKLCLRGVTDYWINDALGRPFFVVSKAVDPGLLEVLRQDIVPRLREELPQQPSEKDLEAHPRWSRFEVVFDRGGYSPAFFREMWESHRIACITYRKGADEPWREEEFEEVQVRYPNGDCSWMKLAERGTYLSGAAFWVREIRRLTESGHQTAVLTTNWVAGAGEIGVRMFSRWSQENFFKYMMEHYGIDRLIDYQLEGISETVQVVNPVWRKLDSEIRAVTGKLARKKVLYASRSLEGEIEEARVQQFTQEQTALVESLQEMETQIEQLKARRKENPKHIRFADLPKEEQFQSPRQTKKHFIDTIKMIAYRAETALVGLLRPHLKHKDEARSLIRQILSTDADLQPDLKSENLYVRLHNLTNPKHHEYARRLCDLLNESEVRFPGTNLTLRYDLVSVQNPADPEV